jgi:chromate reductase
MITVISGTNRKNSEALENIPHDWFHEDMYSTPSASLIKLQDEYILPADKLVFFIPEYNGGFPGTIKLFIDACSVREYDRNFQGKKAALLGVASGRAGNLRGMDHLAGVLNYLGSITMPNKLPISQIKKLKDEEGAIADEETLQVMEEHAREFLAF